MQFLPSWVLQEHLRIFAALKEVPQRDADKAVADMLADLGGWAARSREFMNTFLLARRLCFMNNRMENLMEVFSSHNTATSCRSCHSEVVGPFMVIPIIVGPIVHHALTRVALNGGRAFAQGTRADADTVRRHEAASLVRHCPRWRVDDGNSRRAHVGV